MKYPDGKATCKPRCDPGFTSNGNPELICEDCDESCAECRDIGQKWDKLQCTVCASTHPYQYFRSRDWEDNVNTGPKDRNMCVKECYQGLFESSPNICSECSYPCLNCVGSADKCTECFYKGYRDDKLWNLYQDTCVPECPDGTVSMIADIMVGKYTDIFRENEQGIGGNGRHGFCEVCHETCKTCKERPENCVLCQPTHPLFYQERCLDFCPRGSVQSAVVVDGQESAQAGDGNAPSNQNQNSASSRLLADDQNSGDQQAAVNTDFAQCIPCQQGCDECEANDISICHKCTRPFYSHKGKCVEKCPSGFHPDWPELDGRACRPWRLGDAGTIPYPFLICFLIFSIIIGFGMMIRRGYIYKGKAQMESPQNLVVCLLLACTPLQFLSTVAESYLSWVYGVPIFTLVYGIVVVAALVINIVYMYNYKRHFDAMRIPMEYERRWRLGKMKRSEAAKHKEPVDQKFHDYKKMYPCFVYIVYILQVVLGFRMNMTFYSFFYDLRPFKAHWSRVKYYRKQMTWYLIAWIICVDLTNICIDITCMTQIHVQNTHFENRIWYVSQLWITVIENLVLSIISFFLAVFAMEMIKKHLEYCEPKKDKLKFKAAKNTDSDDSWSDYQNLDKKFDKGKMTERNLLMNDLLRRVKFNKMIFLNNKLDELLGAFGSRKCKSMLDMGTGWPLEDDPRLAITWPCSPGLREDYNEQLGEDFRFSKEDAFGVQGNNVYADVKSKFMGMEIGTQDDAGFLEFQDALNRKHGGLLSQTEGDLEERRMKRKNRRRGRKNKYYAQIDHEDDQEAQLADASDAEEQLQVIREQEEEEENLRKAVQAEAQKQKELASQRKREQEEKLAQKQAQEMMDADVRKRKAQEIEAQELAEQKAETERQIKNAKLSKELQAETARERKIAEENQKKRDIEMAQKSAAERAKYEKEEAERKAKEATDAKSKKDQQALAEKQRLIDEQTARDQELQQRLQNQQKKDVNDLTANKEKNAQEDADREAQKREKLTMSPAMTEMNKTIKEADQVMQAIAGENKIDAPPKHELRTFNENDILGDLPRDERGNVVVQSGQIKDKEGNPINPRGYLIDSETGNIVENQTYQTMFKKEQLDQRGEIPAPFSFERFNFNPHNLMGDFDYQNGKPELMQSQQGFFIDKRSRRCNKHGWMVLLNQGHIVDISGRKRFDKNQLQPDGDLHKLFNYQGRKFDIKEVIGAFEKDEKSQIIIQKSQKVAMLTFQAAE